MNNLNESEANNLNQCSFCNKAGKDLYKCPQCQKPFHGNCYINYITDFECCPLCHKRVNPNSIIKSKSANNRALQPKTAPILLLPKDQTPIKLPQRESECFVTKLFARRIIKCKTHIHHNLNFYCEQCNVLLCIKCIESNHNDHSTTLIIDLPDSKKELTVLSDIISKNIKQLQAEIDSSSEKFSGGTLNYCIEVDSVSSQVKRRINAKREEREKQVEAKYTQLIAGADALKKELEDFNYNDENIMTSLQSHFAKCQSALDVIDAKRYFNFDKTLAMDFNLNEIIPPAKSASFAFILPDKNVIFKRYVNIYYFDWVITLQKTEKSTYYTLTMDAKEDSIFSKEFKCSVSFHMKNKEHCDIKKEIDYTGYTDQLCYLYFFNYSPDLVGKLFEFTITIQPKTFEAIASLQQFKFHNPVVNVPSESKYSKRLIEASQRALIK